MMKLPHSGPIAQAVAGEIDRLTQHPDFHLSEGAAYKAAWDRAGSDALKHCESFRRDCLIASLVASYPGECRRSFIREGGTMPGVGEPE
jgi:hypothetical protein